jgi:hypothetical protein
MATAVGGSTSSDSGNLFLLLLSFLGTVPIAAGTPVVFSMIVGKTNYSTWVNGQPDLVQKPIGPSFTAMFDTLVGARRDQSATDFKVVYNGELASFIILPTIYTDTMRQNMETQLSLQFLPGDATTHVSDIFRIYSFYTINDKKPYNQFKYKIQNVQ